MDKQALFNQIEHGLIVSCQALEHEPLYTKEGGVMPLMAKAAAMSGAVGIRANTVRDITQIKQAVDLPVIGIITSWWPAGWTSWRCRAPAPCGPTARPPPSSSAPSSRNTPSSW